MSFVLAIDQGTTLACDRVSADISIAAQRSRNSSNIFRLRLGRARAEDIWTSTSRPAARR